MTKSQPSMSTEPTRFHDWLNYHHLFYFWMITREGGLARAARALRVSHSTLSAQLRSLELFLGSELFERRGRRLALTPFGAEIASYAEEIFRMGDELLDVARGGSTKRAMLRIGVVDSLPKTLTQRFLAPALQSADPPRLQVRQGELERLLAELAVHRLHVILSDSPAPATARSTVHSQLIGETEIWLYATKAIAKGHRKDFPSSLSGAPVLLPGTHTAMRRALERWFADRGVRPRVVAELDDSAHLRAFGGLGCGIFPVRGALRLEVEESSGAERVGKADGVYERYYVITAERKVRHRGAAALIAAARLHLVSEVPRPMAQRASPAARKKPLKGQ